MTEEEKESLSETVIAGLFLCLLAVFATLVGIINLLARVRRKKS